MLIRKNYSFSAGPGRKSTDSCDYEEPDVCPQCKKALKPQMLFESTFQDQKNAWYLVHLYLCNSCYRPFIAVYSCAETGTIVNSGHLFKARLLQVEPQQYQERSFEKTIKDLSPQFVKIYNQAWESETRNMDELAGIGYRKAMEFLIKDYCIHKNPDAQDEIKALPLGQCISRFIDSAQIKTLATRATWIGNDETHYIRKHEDRDIQDMKRFIDAAVHFISMDLIYEDAESMAPA